MTEATALRRLSPADRFRPDQAFVEAVISGFSERPRVIPARFFYDRAGSQLFEAITRLPAYYPTRTETALLAAHATEIGRLIGPGRVVIEFGSGSSAKTPLLLAAVSASAYVPIDISGSFLLDAADALAASHPKLAVYPVAADFTELVDLPPAVDKWARLGFFPGSTIGNFTHLAAVDLLRRFRTTLGPDAWLVIGIDTRKDERILRSAYDDADGVTAAFNLNLLHRINRELAGTIPVDAFTHEIRWNEPLGRVEMHLRARRAVRASVLGRGFEIAHNETIHTENSYKYSMVEARLLARSAGWEPVAEWTDQDALFGLHVWRAAAPRLDP